jgi:hypothetical protein
MKFRVTSTRGTVKDITFSGTIQQFVNFYGKGRGMPDGECVSVAPVDDTPVPDVAPAPVELEVKLVNRPKAKSTKKE